MSQPLQLLPVDPEDIPALVSVWFAAFSSPFFHHLWPPTPGVREWWTLSFHTDMTAKPTQKFIKVVDPNTLVNGRPRIAAFAKWDLATPEQRGPRFPAWHEDMPGEELDVLFQREESERTRIMGMERHYYLDTVATHPEYQRRGCGGMLVGWGCELADGDGVAAYVDASKDGAPLYARYGFVDRTEGESEIASMARPRKT